MQKIKIYDFIKGIETKIPNNWNEVILSNIIKIKPEYSYIDLFNIKKVAYLELKYEYFPDWNDMLLLTSTIIAVFLGIINEVSDILKISNTIATLVILMVINIIFKMIFGVKNSKKKYKVEILLLEIDKIFIREQFEVYDNMFKNRKISKIEKNKKQSDLLEIKKLYDDCEITECIFYREIELLARE